MNKWHVLGAGALGQWLHRHLSPELQGQLIGRTTPYPRIDQALICVKAYDLPSLALSLAPHLHSDSLCLVVANGKGFESFLQYLAGQIGLVISTAAAWRDSQGISQGVTLGQGLVGSIQGKLEPQRLAPLLPLLNWQLSEPIEQQQWQKLALNACINPLTLVHGCRNGQLLEQHLAQLQALCAELEPLVSHLKLPLAGALATQVQALCQATANNHSSSLQDFLAKRPTELGFILPPWLELAARLGIHCPTLAQLWQQVEPYSPLPSSQFPSSAC